MVNWKKEYRIAFSKNLRNLIESNGDDLPMASFGHLERKQINRILSGQNEPRITTLIPIAKELDIPPKKLFDFEFPMDQVDN